jgi:[ribosomal protein S5]-alanine N-acetyltransferase
VNRGRVGQSVRDPCEGRNRRGHHDLEPVYGPFRSANLGFWVVMHLNGRRLATRAVGAVVEIAFRDLGLHRLEAGTLADNVASQRVLENNRFEQIGLARRYLQIAGEWRDHVLYQRTMA